MAAHGACAARSDTGYWISRSTIPDAVENRLGGFRRGLKEVGYVEGENIIIVHRWAEDQTDRLQLLAADLVSRSVAAIVTAGVPSSLAAKAATTTVPIIFVVGNDPVQIGLAARHSRPGGNLTGINIFTSELVAKRLEVLRDLLPKATRMAVLVNPADAGASDSQVSNQVVEAQTVKQSRRLPDRWHGRRAACRRDQRLWAARTRAGSGRQPGSSSSIGLES